MGTYDESFVIAKNRRPWLRWLKRIAAGLLVLAILAVCMQSWRHYRISKRLDEALSELDRIEPGWRLEDIEAAREQIPEEENSARIVTVAAKLLPKQWPSQEFSDLFTHLAPEEQLTPDALVRLKAELDKVRPALKEAHKLAGMPRGRHRIAYKRPVFDTMLTDQAEGRRVVWLLAYDAMRHGQERDMTDALISCRAAFNAARSLGDEPLAISQLVRTACVLIACRSVERVLAQGEPPAEELDDFAKRLDNEDAYLDLLVSARGERACDHATFEALEYGDSSVSALGGGRPSWHERSFSFLYRDLFRDEHPTMLAMMKRWIDIAQMPMWEQDAAEQQFNQNIRALPRTAILTRLLLPALTKLGEASRRKHAYLRCMTIVLAAERYRREKKTWPETIDTLCPKYLSAVPLDPFDGRPLRYRRVEDGVVIYSVGKDGVDNDGNLDRDNPIRPGTDIGYRLWDVAKRRQPPRPKAPEVDPKR